MLNMHVATRVRLPITSSAFLLLLGQKRILNDPRHCTHPLRMPKHPRQSLTPQRIREVKKPGDSADGNGLCLQVDDTGNKRWMQRITIAGKRHNLGLGGYPVVTLRDAREQAANKRAAREGRDPLAE